MQLLVPADVIVDALSAARVHLDTQAVRAARLHVFVAGPN
jgi:hypothetical protein